MLAHDPILRQPRAPRWTAGCLACPPRLQCPSQRQRRRAWRAACSAEEVVEAPAAAEQVRLPKFRPFNPQNHAREVALSFRHSVPCEAGQLVVLPLRQEWVSAAADILTESFAQSMGYLKPYENFLRYQIRQYLTNHLDIPPKAVLLVGVLQPLGGLSGEAAGASQASGSVEDSVAAVESSSNGGSGGDGSSEAAGERATSSPPAPEAAAGSGSISSDGSWSTGSSSTGSSSTGSSTGSAPSRLLVTPQAAAEMDAAAAAATAAMFFPLPSDGGAGASAATTSSDGNEGDSTDQEGSSASDGVAAEDGLVVGVVEVSFNSSTRTKYLTLNSPQDRPYLCNMAVDPRHRGRGYGAALLQAAEQLVASLGETEIYLHVRLVDDFAARLYERAGYRSLQRDNPLVALFGMDRRALMRKRLR